VVEHRLDVDDRRPVERLEIAYADSPALNGEYPHAARRIRLIVGGQ